MARSFKIARVLSVLLSPILLTGTLGLVGQSGVAEAASCGSPTGVAITGTVTDQTGAGVNGVSVEAYDPGTNTAEAGPCLSESDGTYELDIDPGTYDIHFTPPSGSGLSTVVEQNYTVMTAQVLDVQFSAASHTFSGTITDANGAPVNDLLIQIYGTRFADQYSTRTDTSGNYSITAAPDSYGLDVYSPDGSSWVVRSASDTAYNLNSADVTQSVQLPQIANVTVITKDSTGNLVANATATVACSGSVANPSGPTLNLFTGESATTAANGQAVIPVFRNLTCPANQVRVQFPGSPAAVFSTTDVSTASGDATVTIQQPANNTLSGTVTDSTGTPLSGIVVQIYGNNNGNDQYTTTTDVSGNYSFSAAPDIYNISFYAPDEQSWAIHNASGTTYNLETGNATQNVQLPQPVTVTVVAKDSGGNLVSGATASAACSGSLTDAGASFDVFTSGSANTEANGEASIAAFRNLTCPANRVLVQYPGSSAPTYSTADVSTANGDVTVVIQEAPTSTLSGSVTDSTGAPVAGVHVRIYGNNNGNDQYATTTDSSGAYSIAAAPDVYTLNFRAPDDNSWAINSSGGTTFNLQSGSVIQNLQLPQTATVTIVPKDATGSPVAGATASAACSGNLTASGAAFDVFTSGTVNTDSNGQAVIAAFRNLTCAANQVLVQYPGDSAPTYNTQAISTANGNVTVVFQKQPATTAPTITSPATYTTNARDVTNFTVTTTGNPAASITESGTLPPGLTFTDNGNGTATIGGQASPVNDGIYALHLTATNSAGTATQTLYFSVNNAQTTPTFVSAASATESYGTAFSYTVDTTGNPLPTIKRDANDNSFPTGVSIKDNKDGTATLSGTGSTRLARGTYTFTLQAKNKNGTATQTFSLTIN